MTNTTNDADQSSVDVLIPPKRYSRAVLYVSIGAIFLLLQLRVTLPTTWSPVLQYDVGAAWSTTSSSSSSSTTTAAPTRMGEEDQQHLDDEPPIESLIKLTKSYKQEVTCPSPLRLVNDTLLDDPALAFAGGRKIPRIVHISSGSRCNDKIIAKNLDTWRLKDHYFFLHDDHAVLELLNQDWPEFPLLKHIMTCFPKGMGATWIDLWRLLVLWKYGGIYADLDTSPVPSLFNESTISSDDDAFFVVDQTGGPSQWFMAASPHHPMIYLSVFGLIVNVMNENDLGNFQVVFTTGPGAVMQGFVSFMRNKRFFWKSPAGHYVGVDNRTVTLVGNRSNENLYITRVIKPLRSNDYKHKVYQKMNMSHLTKTAGTIYKRIVNVDESCLSRLYRFERERKRNSINPSNSGNNYK